MTPTPGRRKLQLAFDDRSPRCSTPGDGDGEPLARALLKLETEAGPRYWLGLQNFYVITRYNWSSYYAMAVIELGRGSVTL